MDHEHHYSQNLNPSSTHVTDNPGTPLEFVIGDYLLLEDGDLEKGFSPENMVYSDSVSGGASAGFASASSTDSNGGVMKRSEKDHAGLRFAFRTKSELEVLDDGFKWRKYGKKMVKSSPNPR
ncbi:WRKY Transcription Factor [Sarracenia purpurea var. burkii]